MPLFLTVQHRIQGRVVVHLHLREEANRPDATAEHKARCEQKLAVLMEQKKDLSMALDQLLSDIRDGKKYMKVYKQMKMYTDLKTVLDTGDQLFRIEGFRK